jgi:HK97 family phage portal protein
MARKSIGLGMALETFGELYFGQGTHPGVIVSHPGQLSPDSHTRLKDSLSASYSGLGKAHRLMLLEDGMKIEKLGIPPNDSQFLESRQFQIPEIARFFNIPPHKLKDLTKSSFSNIESEQASFYTDCILPWLVRLEKNYNNQLLNKTDKELSGRGRLYFKHSADGIMRATATDRAAFYNSMINMGAFSINEVRELEDKDPIENGDEHFVPLNMVPLSMAKEQFEKKLEAPPAKQQLPAPDTEDQDEENV